MVSDSFSVTVALDGRRMSQCEQPTEARATVAVRSATVAPSASAHMVDECFVVVLSSLTDPPCSIHPAGIVYASWRLMHHEPRSCCEPGKDGVDSAGSAW